MWVFPEVRGKTLRRRCCCNSAFQLGWTSGLEEGVGRGRREKTKQQPYFLEDAKKSTEHVWTLD